MPITALLWPDADLGVSNASDVHVVHGQPSPSLLDRLLVIDHTDNLKKSVADYIKLGHQDLTLEFRPLFTGVLVTDKDDKNTIRYEGLGVSVDMRTGAVAITAPLEAFIPLNFIMVILAKNKPIGASFDDTRLVRVQAHRALQRVWLTPPRLTVRRLPPMPLPEFPPPAGSEPPDPRDTQMRFVVRAQFDDNVIGDLTLESGTTWKSKTTTGPGNVSDRGRLLVDREDLPDAEVEITAIVDARFGEPAAGRSATATMVVKKGWHQLPDAERPVIELVNGSGVPKADKPETHVPNVVLMADGWDSPDEFERLATTIGKTLRTSRVLRPFPHLVDSMCMWGWFVPRPPKAPQSKPGAFSVLSQVYTFEDKEKAGELFASLMPSALPPTDKGGLTLGNLLYVVGLPMPGEQRSVGDLRAHWKATCRDFDDSRVGPNVIEQWLKLRTRTFVDCVDTEFHVGFGRLPSVEPVPIATPAFFGFPNVFRGFESLSSAITVLRTEKATLFGGRPLGELWSDPKNLAKPHPRFDNRQFVICFVPLAGARSHATISGSSAVIATGEQPDGFHVRPSADPKRPGHEPVGEALPANLEALFYTFVHELTHCFGLGDEYADDTRRWDGSVPFYPNLQGDKDVRDTAGQISGNLVRWKWHRIQAAAVIEREISTQDGFFAIDVRPGLATQFSLEQKVLLRLRKFREQFIIDPSVLEFPLLIEEIVGDHRLLVSSAIPIDLEELRTFEPGSIVFLPVKTPPANPDPESLYMHLMTRQIRDWITDEKAPLWAAASEPDNLQGTQIPKLRELSRLLLRCPKNTWRVIGLYEGGIQSASGIYHPAGGCLMRSSGGDVKELCAVCRYVLTDVIDPSLHNANDAVNREIYITD